MKNSDVIEVLNDLITKNYDAEEGYKETAEECDDANLKAFLLRQSKMRYDFGHELKDEVRRLGGEVEKGTSFAADMHRTWINLKSAFTSNDKEAMLEEAERGEENALKHYDEAIEKLSAYNQAFNTVSSQRAKIATALADIRTRHSMVAEV